MDYYAGNMFMSEMHFKQPGFTYSTCGSFRKQEIQDIACFQNDMAYRYLKGLSRRTASDILLSDKTCNIAKNSNFNGYQRILTLIVYKFFNKESRETSTSHRGARIDSDAVSEKQQFVKNTQANNQKTYIKKSIFFFFA